MDTNSFPTKGNLIIAKNTLRLSLQGYDLLDKKRNVLIKEIMELNTKADQVQKDIDIVFTQAYAALQQANIELGANAVNRLSRGVPEETTIKVLSRSIMGVEIPLVTYENSTADRPGYGFANTTIALDEAVAKFNLVKDLTIQLSMMENAAYRLAISIKKTQKRANALKNVTIPKFEALVKNIQNTLEERERDDFTRLKVIKKKRGEIADI